MYGQCKIKKCKCPNGIGSIGNNCTNNGDINAIYVIQDFMKKIKKDSDDFKCVNVISLAILYLVKSV